MITSNNIITFLEETPGQERKPGEVTISDYVNEMVEFHIDGRLLVFNGQELITSILNALRANK